MGHVTAINVHTGETADRAAAAILAGDREGDRGDGGGWLDALIDGPRFGLSFLESVVTFGTQ